MVRVVLCLLALFCLFVSSKGFAETLDYSFDNWRDEDGLSGVTVVDIIEDNIGFIWVATHNGVSKFDGNNFETFSVNNGQLIDNISTALAVDNQGWIWIGSERGLTRIHHLTYESQHFLADENKSDSLIDNSIFDIHVDKKGVVWVATRKGLNKFNIQTQRFQSYLIPKNEANSTYFDTYRVVSDSQNQLYVLTTEGQIYRLDQQQSHFILYQEVKGSVKFLIDENDKLWVAGSGATLSIYDLHTDDKQTVTLLGRGDVNNMSINKSGQVWLTTQFDGVQIVTPQLEVKRISENSSAHTMSLLKDSYLSIYIDKSDHAWLGGNLFGLFRQNKVASNIRQAISPEQANNAAFAIAESLDGDIWLGFNQRIDIVDGNNFGILKHSIEMENYTYDIKQLDSSTWLAGTTNGLVKIVRQDDVYVKETVYHSNELFAFRLVILGQSLYVAGHNGIYYIEDIKRWTQPLQKLQAEQPEKVSFNLNVFYYGGLLDNQGRLWFSGVSGGIVFVDPKRNVIEPQKLLVNEKGLAITVIAMTQLNQGSLLLSSLTGLYQYDIASKNITTLDIFTKQFTVCESVTIDNSIWLNADVGVFELDKNSRQIKRMLNESSGILGGCVFLASLLTKKQCIVFGMANGVNKYCPKDLPTVNSKAINAPLFTNLDINYKEHLPFAQYQQYSEQPILTTNRLLFDHRVNHFNLDFTTLDFSGRQLNYAYKLDGLMDEWIYIDRSKAAFTTLPSGEYRLKVKVYDQYFPEHFAVNELVITKMPPWWLSMSAYFVYIILVLSAFVAIYKYKTFRNKRLTKQLKKLVHNKTAQLIEKNNEILRQKQDLELAATRQEQLMEQKNTMLSAISHEMKTPLTVLKGSLQHMEIKSQKKDLTFELMSNNCDRLTAFVDQILQVSKFQTLQHIEMQQVPISAIVRTVVNYLQPVAAKYNQRLQLFVQDQISLTGNAAGIELTVNNLIKNAIVHAGAGCIIEVKLQFAHSQTIIVVTDNGKGIDDVTQTQMFDPFVSGSKDSGSVHSGLGLALCQQIIEAHKGEIDVESELGKGTRFTITFPSGELIQEIQDYVSTLPSFVMSAPVQSSTDQNYPLVLIADDEPDILVLLSLHLNDEYRLLLANSGQEAIELLKQHQPDIVIVDRYMPDISGIEVLRQVRLLEQTKAIPVIIFSADTSDENQIEGLREGSDMFIKKPFDYYLLKASIRRLIEKVSFADKEIQLEQNLQDESLTEQPTNAQITVAREKDFLAQLSEVVQQNYQDPEFTVKCLATQFTMSGVTFRNKVQQMTGVLPKHYLFNYRCEKAKVRLDLESELSIVDIAYSCGFKDEGQMRRWFKEFYGLTPSQMRKPT